MKIRTKEELSHFLSKDIHFCPKVRRYNKLKKHIEYFVISRIIYPEHSWEKVYNYETTFELIRETNIGSNENPTKIEVDFYTLISAFDFVK